MSEASAGWDPGLVGGSVTTGRYLISFRDLDADRGHRLYDSAGIKSIAVSSELKERTSDVPGAELVMFPSIRAGVARIDPDQVRALSVEAERVDLRVIEPERYIYAASAGAGDDDLSYLRGFRDGVMHAGANAAPSAHRSAARPGMGSPGPMSWPGRGAMAGETWGLTAMHLGLGRGSGVTVAVLDTGLDFGHPDFGHLSKLTGVSMTGDGSPQDVHGHGTHCAGIICASPSAESGQPRYGVATDVNLLVGKVLGPDGRGVEGDLLAGIEWAADEGARIVSMSVSAPPLPGDTYSTLFEGVARDLLDEGVVLVAAAGNESRRSRGHVAAPGRPASSPSVVSVAALDQDLQVAEFSNGSYGSAVGQVDIAGPGVDVLSAWLEPARYRNLNGTSMATPHIAGALALLLERHPHLAGRALVHELFALAERLPAASADVGVGLVQGPL